MTPDDADAVFAITRATHEMSAMKMFPFSRARFDEHVESYFAQGGAQAVVVAEVDGQVVGMVWLRCGTFSYSDEAKLASIVALSVAHEPIGPFLRARVFLKLISAAKALADQWGALKLSLHAMSGDQAGRSDRLFRRRGAELIGGNYVL
jgi:predicted N-acetyltransferase YhbS